MRFVRMCINLGFYIRTVSLKWMCYYALRKCDECKRHVVLNSVLQSKEWLLLEDAEQVDHRVCSRSEVTVSGHGGRLVRALGCNAESTGSSIARDSYCVGTLSKSFAHSQYNCICDFVVCALLNFLKRAIPKYS